MPKLLDISALPSERIYKCKDGSLINMRALLESLRVPIDDLGVFGCIGQVESFGFAMAKPLGVMDDDDGLENLWDDPAKYIDFVGGWGPDRDMFKANAVRKMRAMFRVGQETLPMRLSAHSDTYFMDVVDQTDTDGNFPWGDYPYGGAVRVLIGDYLLYGAVSTFEDDKDDDLVARIPLGVLGNRIINGGGLLSKVA